MEIFDTLRNYKQLKDEGLIDAEEYQKMKASVLQQKINAPDPVEYMRGLKELFDADVITQEEFADQKARMINNDIQAGKKTNIELSTAQFSKGLDTIKEKGRESLKFEKGGKFVISKKLLVIIAAVAVVVVGIAVFSGGGGGTKLPGDVRWGDSVEDVQKGAAKLGATRVSQEDVTFEAYDAEYLGYACEIDWYVSPTTSLYPIVNVSYNASKNPLMTFASVREQVEKKYGKADKEEEDGYDHYVYWDEGDTVIKLWEYTKPSSNLYENVYLSFEQK